MTWDDIKMFLWYLVTEPYRNIKQNAKDFASSTKKDMQNLRLWSQFLILSSALVLFLKGYGAASIFLTGGVILFLVYEWKRKYYRHRWNQRHIERIRNARPKDVDRVKP